MPLSRRIILVGAVLFLSGYMAAPALGQADGFPWNGLSSASAGGGSDASPSAKLHPALLRELDESDEPVKAWVFFTDKGVGSQRAYDQAIQRVASSYNRRAIQRRMLRGTGAARGGAVFNEHDLPVVQVYVDAVVATGARRHVTSTWVNAVSVYGTRKQFEKIAVLPFVAKLQPVARTARIIPPEPDEVSDEQSARLPRPVPPGAEREAGVRGLIDYGASEEQLAQINLIALHNEGYTGDGVIVGILDTGFHRSHLAFNNQYHRLNIVAEWDFVNDDENTDFDPGDPSGQYNHGTMILGCLGAYEPGELVGGAYDAAFILCKTEDVTDEYPAEEDNFVAGLQFIEANGGDMATSSLGYIDWYTQGDLDGLTAVTTVAVNIATTNGVHCCTAAGNAGHDSNPVTSSLIAPADALEVITCGAVNSSGSIASFSSSGPSADGRVKPEVLARGVSTHTVSPYTVDTYMTANGTSLSTPLVACAVACLIQADPQWTVAQMRDHLFYTAGDYVVNGTYDPLHIRGYGVINAHLAHADCNISGIADECDVDCGSPGGPCDVPGCGGSLDCNANSVPDECEIDIDCNNNSIPDDCDIDPTDPDGNEEVSLDENQNLVPDECDPFDPPEPEVSPVRKTRYISFQPNNTENIVAMQVTLASMKRCGGLLSWTCSSDGDCPLVCDNDSTRTCTADTQCEGEGACNVSTAPCVEHPGVGNVTKWVGEPWDPCWNPTPCACLPCCCIKCIVPSVVSVESSEDL